ncbi:MAG: hypothetical protein NW226_03095 [Microscillaceae bacterium]|nr:hypothetical protein [Microscillaceae bacterium]
MSILRSIIDSIRASVSNEAFEKVKQKEYHDQVINAIHKASEDGDITAEEIADVKGLIGMLNITESEMGHVKLDIMRHLLTRILADSKVTEEEIALFKEVEDGLSFAKEDKAHLEDEITQMKALYNK